MYTREFVNKAVFTSSREGVYVYEKMILLINRAILRKIQGLGSPKFYISGSSLVFQKWWL